MARARAREIAIPGGGGHTLTIHELDDVYNPLTGRALTGSWLWDSALVLSHCLATSSSSLFHDKSVIELGAGTGLPGLTAALLGAARVLLTDIRPILPCLAKNVEANGLGDRVEVRELVWGHMDEYLSEFGGFDLVLMSDVFFDPAEMPALAETLKMVSKEGTRIWAASEVRPWTGECINQLVCRGFEVTEMTSQGAASTTSLPGEEERTFAMYSLAPPTGHTDNEEITVSTAGPDDISVKIV